MKPCISPTTLPEWQALLAHQQQHKAWHLRDLFHQDPERFKKFYLTAPGLALDFSHHLIDQTTQALLCDLAKRLHLSDAISALLSGEKVNSTEDRAAWHTALRAPDTQLPEVALTLQKMAKLSDLVRSGKYLGFSGKPIRQVINIGIGGSDLGPKMATYALKSFCHPNIQNYFVSNLDARHLQECLTHCDPESTLFIVSSKTFTTRETLANVEAAREWLMQAAGRQDIAAHFIAVTAAPARALSMGFSEQHIYPFWDWVGGRYSVWSAVSLSLVIALGMDRFKQLLQGAHAMDQHFATAPFEKNAPVMMALLAIWYTNFWHCQTQAIIPYCQGLNLFPDYLQQLCMESLGKSVRSDGQDVDYDTGGVIWGGQGTNSQHSFHQLLLQGTHKVPIDFIFAVRVPEQKSNHAEMIAHCLAQSEVFAFGYEPDQAQVPRELCSHQKIRGNQPHSLIILDNLTPFELGALIALYEHKVYVQSVLWQINAFDQWGVQRAKALTERILQELQQSSQGHKGVANTTKELVAGRLRGE